MASFRLALLSALAPLAGCAAIAQPKSVPPSAELALAALRFDRACGVASRAQATLSLVTPTASFRGDAQLLVAVPHSLRLEVQSSFGLALLQLAAERDMVAVDPRNRVYSEGPNEPCTLQAWLGLPIPTELLVSVLRGSVPVIVHDRSTVSWTGDGAWSLTFEGNGLTETVRLDVAADRRDAAWTEQGFTVRDAEVRASSRVLWRLEADKHAPAPRAPALVDPDGIDDPVEPSGPACEAALPRRVVLTLPERNATLRLDLHDSAWNPPLLPSSFVLARPEGFRREVLRCVEASPVSYP